MHASGIRIQTVTANQAADIEAARALMREYADWLAIDLATQNFEQELASLPGRYAPPSGRLLLARAGDVPAGCVALRDLGDGVSEMKRLWVRPAFQARGLGRLLVERIVAEARQIGYERMRLDTLPRRMPAAGRLYRAFGFRPIEKYYDNPIAGVEYMELRLRAGFEG